MSSGELRSTSVMMVSTSADDDMLIDGIPSVSSEAVDAGRKSAEVRE